MAEVRQVADPNTPEPQVKPVEDRESYERPTIEMFRPMSNVAFGTNVTITVVNITGP
jgi:hypothetical protein